VQIRDAYGFVEFPTAVEELTRWVDDRAWTTGDGPKALFDGAVVWLREHQTLLPGVSTLARLVARVRDAALQRLWDTLAAALTAAQASTLRWGCCWRSRTGHGPRIWNGCAVARPGCRVGRWRRRWTGSASCPRPASVRSRSVRSRDGGWLSWPATAWPARRRRCAATPAPAGWRPCWPRSWCCSPGPPTTRWSCSTC
jgi:Domain of unknown function (DUF4158)